MKKATKSVVPSGMIAGTITGLILTFALLPLFPTVHAQNITQIIVNQTRDIRECYLGTQAMIPE